MRYAALVLACLIAAPLSAESSRIRQIERSFSLEGQKSVRVDLPVAEVHVVGSSQDTVEVDFTATCKRERDCREVLEALDFDSHGSRNTLRLDLVGYPKWGKGRVELEGEIRFPRSLDLKLELGVGEIEIKQTGGDVRVELGVGEINAWVALDVVRSVTLDAGVGEAELYGADRRVAGRRSMLVGSEVHWDEGKGDARIFLEVGVGEVSVWLE